MFSHEFFDLSRPRRVVYYSFRMRPLGSALGEFFDLVIVTQLAACWLARQKFWAILVC